MTWSVNVCPRHLPFMLFVDKLYLEFYNYMCVNGYVKMYIKIVALIITLLVEKDWWVGYEICKYTAASLAYNTLGCAIKK